MNKPRLITAVIAAILWIHPLQAETVEQLQKKLDSATREIQVLKAKLAQSQVAIEVAKLGKALPVPSATVLDAEHPVLTAYEFAALSADETNNFKERLKGKIISVTGEISRFSDGIGRGFKIILKTDGVDRDVVCKFYAPLDVTSAHTADDGGEMILEYARRGPTLLASVHDAVVITGFFGDKTRTQVNLTDCVLQRK